MKSVRRFFIGAGIFLVTALLAVATAICFNIDRKTVNGLIRPSNTAVYRYHLTVYSNPMINRWTQGIVYYGEKGKVLQRDIIDSHQVGPKSSLYVSESQVYSTGANGKQLLSEEIQYSPGLDYKNRVDPITYRCYARYESGAVYCRGEASFEKIDGKYCLNDVTIQYTYFNEEGEKTFEETVPFDPLAVDNYLLQHLLLERPLSEYDPYPELKTLILN